MIRSAEEIVCACAEDKFRITEKSSHRIGCALGSVPTAVGDTLSRGVDDVEYISAVIVDYLYVFRRLYYVDVSLARGGI